MSGDQHDLPRLVDFLRVEHITTDLQGSTKAQAIEQLTKLLASSHRLDGFDRKRFLASVIEREEQVSTFLGNGIAVPHGQLLVGNRMVAVMGISCDGLDFDTPDGRRVHCMVLLGTPSGLEVQHLEMLAALARTVGTDQATQHALFAATSPREAHDILRRHAQEQDGLSAADGA